jgi:tRNA threonylcarbamoyl adenosine modification protein YeaZ
VHTLFFNIVSHHKSFAVVEDLFVKRIYETDAQVSDRELLPLIQGVLADASITFQEVDRIACAVGPGGFTSLRIAVSCANTLADQLCIPSSGVHLCDFLRSRTKEPNVLWLHSTKKDQLFVCGGEWAEPTLVQLDEVISKVITLNAENWVGELIPEHMHIVEILKQEPLTSLSESLPSFLSSLEYKTELLQPWYGRGW